MLTTSAAGLHDDSVMTSRRHVTRFQSSVELDIHAVDTVAMCVGARVRAVFRCRRALVAVNNSSLSFDQAHVKRGGERQKQECDHDADRQCHR